MKSAYIVQGVGESTGCRMMTEILIRCGCVGSSGHRQAFQPYIINRAFFIDWLKSEQINNLVCRFSWPHGRYRPNVHDFYFRLKEVYDRVYIVLTTRSWICQQIGTIKGKHAENSPIPQIPTAEARMINAYKTVFGDLAKIDNGNFTDFVIVHMGDLLTYPEATIKYTMNRINLTIPKNFDYTFIRPDADVKRINEYLKEN